ncbi:HdeD family acid-resistance protein [Pseudoduganella namucuonensis]|nr:DUF308 domain-containing protein [Pseudoduganella namucuonensis]
MLMKSWWIPGLRGLVAVAVGVAALMLPEITLMTLVALFAAYALLAGGAAMAGAVSTRGEHKDWWLLLLLGACGLAAGVLALWQPALSLLALVIVIGVAALVTGALDLALALRMRHPLRGPEWTLVISAVVSLGFGCIVLLAPDVGLFTMVGLLGVYCIVAGGLYLATAYTAFMHHRHAGRFGPGAGRTERRNHERRMTASHAT